VINKKELNPHDYPLSAEQLTNFETLHTKLNRIRQDFGKPMIITSGVRSIEDQTRIDRKRIGVSGKPAAVRKGSCHLKAAAADIADRTGELAAWLLEDHGRRLKEYDVYIEDPIVTKVYVHIQVLAPRSGNRVFQP